MPTPRRTRPRTVVATAAITVLLVSCGASGGSSDAAPDGDATTTAPTSTSAPTTTEAPDDTDGDPVQTLHDAVDRTLELDSFAIEARTALSLPGQTFGYEASGAVDYGDPPITDATLTFEQDGEVTAMEQRADGTHLWIRASGPLVPEFPEGKTWVQGDADLLFGTDSFEPAGLVGVVIALRAAEDVQVGEAEDLDGVATTSYRTSVSYEAAVEAAGADRDDFTSSLSLTSPKDPILDIEVWIDDDGIVRRMALEIDDGTSGIGLSGTYEFELTDVNEEVDLPEAPDPDDTLTGPAAEELLSQLLL